MSKDYIGLTKKCVDQAARLPFKHSENETTVALLKWSASAISELYENLVDCRNELCWRCEKYKQAHKGACDGCRWKEAV